jgi:hypothetical protein
MKYVTVLHFELRKEAEGGPIGTIRVEVDGPRMLNAQKDEIHEKLTEIFEGYWVKRDRLEGASTKRKI